MSRQICVISPTDSDYSRFWGKLGKIRPVADFRKYAHDFDLLCFTGGEDVSPSYYGHRNMGSYCSPERDAFEKELFTMAMEYGIPMTGICRGSQFLNVMCGGTMVQDLRESHGGGRHLCQTFDGQEMEVTSSHHQMVVPGKGAEVLAWAEKRLRPSAFTYDGQLPDVVRDPENLEMIRITEAYAYPALKIFGVQHHPEWQEPTAEAVRWTHKMIRRYCWGEEEQCA